MNITKKQVLKIGISYASYSEVLEYIPIPKKRYLKYTAKESFTKLLLPKASPCGELWTANIPIINPAIASQPSSLLLDPCAINKSATSTNKAVQQTIISGVSNV